MGCFLDEKKIFSESKQILKEISGVFKSGELTAIMGPTGAGKSILMNILTGFTHQGIGGHAQMNNVEILSASYGRDCSYILQDDNLYPDFSLQETMMIAANLKIGGVNLQTKQDIIDKILKSLQLLHSKETLCAKLSGGERKRLSIALELLDNRPVLFLDEPTSGLDSVSAALCVRLLRKFAHEGRIIVCTIHQPEARVFDQFDHVYVLTDGSCTYQGSVTNSIHYLEDSIGLRCPQYHNPADYLIEVVNGEYGDYQKQLVQSADDVRWRAPNLRQSEERLEIFELDEKFSNCTTEYGQSVLYSIPSEWTRFFVLLARCSIHSHRDWTVTYLKWGCHVVTAILMALIFGDSGSNATKSIANLFLILGNIMYVWYTAIMPSVLKFPCEFSIIKKETFNNWYSLRTYFLANMVVATPIHIVFALTISTMVYIFTDQPLEFERYVKFSCVIILINSIADAIGLIVGTLFNPIHGTFIAAIFGIINVTLSGILAMRSQVSNSIRIGMDMMPMYYAVEALVLSLYDNDREDMTCPVTEFYCPYKSPNMLMDEIGVRKSHFEYDIGIIIMQAVVLKLFAYFAMKRRIKHGK